MSTSSPIERDLYQEAIQEAADKAGGIVSLSLQLGLSRGAACQWKKIPPEQVLKVEMLTGVSRYRQRPDIFGTTEQSSVSSSG